MSAELELEREYYKRSYIDRAYLRLRAQYTDAPDAPWRARVAQLEDAFCKIEDRARYCIQPSPELRKWLDFLCGEYPTKLFRECDEELAKKKKRALLAQKNHDRAKVCQLVDEDRRIRKSMFVRIGYLEGIIDEVWLHVSRASVAETILEYLAQLLGREKTLGGFLPTTFVKARLKGSAQAMRDAKSDQSSAVRNDVRKKATALKKISPVFFKAPGTAAKEMLRRGETGEVGGVAGVSKTALRGYIADMCGS